VWQADEATKALRRQVGQHLSLVRQRARVKNQVQAILARNLLPRCPFADLFGTKGRRWLDDQELPADERRTVRSLLRQLDFAGGELKLVDAELARFALDDVNTRRLMTIPGVDMAVAVAIVATVGDFSRFESPDKLVSYVGLNPSARQSGGLPATTGRISKQTGVGSRNAGRSRPRGQPHPWAPPAACPGRPTCTAHPGRQRGLRDRQPPRRWRRGLASTLAYSSPPATTGGLVGWSTWRVRRALHFSGPSIHNIWL